jgi:hypothetical protein
MRGTRRRASEAQKGMALLEPRPRGSPGDKNPHMRQSNRRIGTKLRALFWERNCKIGKLIIFGKSSQLSGMSGFRLDEGSTSPKKDKVSPNIGFISRNFRGARELRLAAEAQPRFHGRSVRAPTAALDLEEAGRWSKRVFVSRRRRSQVETFSWTAGVGNLANGIPNFAVRCNGQ